MPHSRAAWVGAVGLWLVAALGVPVPVHADGGVGAAEELVRAQWIEGLPFERARALEPAGVRRVAELLEDPAESANHVHAVMALGLSESPEAYPALARFAAREPRGPIEAGEYRARNALPVALGHLARGDRRALLLLERLLAERRVPGWSYRHLAGERLRDQLEHKALTGLGVSGLPEADALLARAARGAAGKRAAQIGELRALNARVAREGAPRVFGGEP